MYSQKVLERFILDQLTSYFKSILCEFRSAIVNGKESGTATQTQTKDNLLGSLWYLRGGREGAHIPSPVYD